MATKLICDRCGAEINPKSAVTYAGMRRHKTTENETDYELRAWLTGKEGGKDVES